MCSVSGVCRRAVGRESRAQGGQFSAGRGPHRSAREAAPESAEVTSAVTEEAIGKTGEKLDLRIREMLTELSKCGSRSLV